MRLLLVHPSSLVYSEIFLRLEPRGPERVAGAARKPGTPYVPGLRVSAPFHPRRGRGVGHRPGRRAGPAPSGFPGAFLNLRLGVIRHIWLITPGPPLA